MLRVTLRFTLLCAVFLAIAAPSALAVETEMTGTPNLSFITNLQYEQRYDSGANGGSDLEFMTLTIPGSEVRDLPPAAPAQPAKTNGKKSKRAKKARKRYRSCMRKAKRKRGSARRRATRKCKRAYKRSRSRRARTADVDASAPGVQRTFAFAGSYYNGLQIIDVSDPEKPVLAINYDCGIAQGDVQVFRREDLGGRVFVGYGADDGYSNNADSACFTEAAAAGYDVEVAQGTFFIEVTDPYHPKTVSFISFPKGSHNLTIHPSGKYLYNSNSDTLGASGFGIEVADISDITKPEQAGFLPLDIRPGLGSESHDIWFNADGTRAYSAAVSQGVVIDTTNPAEPSVISSIFDPTVNVWHQAETVEAEVPGLGTRTLLIGADEFAGAIPTGQCPNGGLHIYDVTGELEAAPVKLGYWNFDEVRPTDDMLGCTAHVFQIFRDQQIMLIANYNGGVHVLDIAGLAGVGFGDASTGITELARGRFTDSNTWAVKSPSFTRDGVSYMYGNDEIRGFDVYRYDASAPQSRALRGNWYAPGTEPRMGPLPAGLVADALLRGR